MLETYYSKETLKTGIKRNVFYYTVEHSSDKRGYNRTIKAYILNKDYSPSCIGEAHVNTASYKGDKPTAIDIICDIFKYKTNGYDLLNKDIKVFQI